jgi:hypothetical protein
MSSNHLLFRKVDIPMKKLVQALGAVALVVSALPASAAVVIGPYTFVDNAFADMVTASGNFTTFDGPALPQPTLSAALTDKSVNTGAFSTTPGEAASLTLDFTDNIVFNGSGTDLVLFEEGFPGVFGVTINGTTLTFLSVALLPALNNTSSQPVNAAEIDLQLFGVSPGGTISSLKIDMRGSSTSTSDLRPTLLEAGALNSRDAGAVVPEPSSWALTGVALLGLAASRRRVR